MIDRETIEAEIISLEKRDTTFATVERLAWLYIVRENLIKAAEPETYAGGTGSDFLTAAAGVPIDSLMQIIDQHMECVRVLYPIEYQAIIDKIKAI